MRFMTARIEKPAKPAPAARLRRSRRWTRRRLLAGTGAALLLAAAAGGWWLHRTGIIAAAGGAAEQRILAWTAHGGLALRYVEVEGRERASRAAILDALDVKRGMPILAVDPAAAKHRLESIPWVRSVSVERRLPDTLYIRLVEREPLAFWQRDNRLVLIDRNGVEVPSEHLDRFHNLIVLVGADAPQQGAALIDMLATEPQLARHVVAAVRVGGRRWNLTLDNHIDVALPEEDAGAAWRHLARMEREDGILERNIEMVDMRLHDRLVVRLPPDIQKTPPKKGRQPGKTT